MSEYSICGVMIHARPDKKNQVEQTLLDTKGVELHGSSSEGKLVVTVESEDQYYVADTISAFKDIDGVLCASMIYQCTDNTNTTNQGVEA
jgi:periplasmic nitrate reductase NapD